MAENVWELSDADFETKVKDSATPVVVDFWAPWCGPCKLITPLMGELATEYAGKVSFAKIDIQGNPDVAVKYGIKSIPALLFFKDGNVAATIVGAVPKDKIKVKIEEVLAG